MKKFLAFPFAIASAFAVALPVFAQPVTPSSIDTCPPDQFHALCNLTFNGGLIGNLITFAFVIAIVLALAWLIYGGIRWILSQGDKGKVDSARQHIIAALIGLIIVFLSYFLLNIVLNFFGLTGGIRDLKIPNITATAPGPGGVIANGDVCPSNATSDCTCKIITSSASCPAGHTCGVKADGVTAVCP